MCTLCTVILYLYDCVCLVGSLHVQVYVQTTCTCMYTTYYHYAVYGYQSASSRNLDASFRNKINVHTLSCEKMCLNSVQYMYVCN